MAAYSRKSAIKRSAVLVFATAVSVLGILFAVTPLGYAQPAGEERLRLLTAVGNAEVRVRPDLAEVRLGVETEARTAVEARQQNAIRAAKVVDVLKALGVPERALETSLFQLEPVRRFEDRDQSGQPPIVGYRVSNVVSVRTEQLDLVPGIVDESVRAGANRVDSVSFTLRSETVPRQTALRQAVANARENAEAMAKELGVELAGVHNVQQGGVGVGPRPLYFGGLGAEGFAPTPVFPGEVTVSASATLTYLIR